MSAPTLKRKRSPKDDKEGAKLSRRNAHHLGAYLEKIGVQGKRLVFEVAKITDLTNELTTDAEAQILDLHARIKEIYACVTMDYEPGSRMILDALLLALRKISSTQEFDVAILPEMRITHGNGVQISHPTSGDELWLDGNVDYAVIDIKHRRSMNCFTAFSERLLGPGGSRWYTFEIASGCLVLVEAKRQSNEQGLSTYVPEAVSQAIALLKTANLPEVRFCLFDGQTWFFFILKSENNTLTYYGSGIHRLSRDIAKNTDMPLREIVRLIREWLKPTVDGLFELK
ncbi:hypothetical protein EDB87DRAFT_1578043 [Lactarius vividus]|nr:hypothetical protein EDB87DRAFT_1578043 [Lactarius vividus]